MDLDVPDKAPVADNIRSPHIPRQVRIWMMILTIAGMGGLLLLIQVSLPRVPKQAAHSAVSAPVVPLDVLV
ncbi:MAG TPA: hypothetical protein DEV72_12135, partial [Ktedonobacter sp.]|nr:hypothetical protein [Ktedonobacter sp.]